MTLVLIDNTGTTLVPRIPQGDANAEHPLRDLIFDYPEILPLAELEPEIGRVVAVAKEFNMPGAGFADVLLVSEWGRLIIVECKLWRADSDDAGHLFRSDPGHRSDLIPAGC